MTQILYGVIRWPKQIPQLVAASHSFETRIPLRKYYTSVVVKAISKVIYERFLLLLAFSKTAGFFFALILIVRISSFLLHYTCFILQYLAAVCVCIVLQVVIISYWISVIVGVSQL